MKWIVVSIYLLLALAASAQSGITEQQVNEVRAATKKMDSIRSSLDSSLESMFRTEDSLDAANIKKNAANDAEAVLRLHNERRAKARKRMYIYFGLGIFFLMVLVAGLLRKGKAKG